MGFNTNTTNTNKNQFVASITSDKSGKTAVWLNPTDSFIKATIGADIKLVTAEEVKAKLLEVLLSGDFSLTVKDTTIEQAVISVDQF